MKRTALDTLVRLAWDNGASVEYDAEQNVAVLKLGRQTFYADLPAEDAAENEAAVSS